MRKLETREISKTYRGRKVVDDVSVFVQQGEIVGLLGPNGAGKTTSFYMMVGLISPDKGDVFIGGQKLTGVPMYLPALAGIGDLAQEPSIFRKLTVEENVMAILQTLGIPRAEQKRRLEALLDELSIKHVRKSYAYSLSGGERRRLEITRALVGQPKLMLLDEPFAGVDPIAVHDIQTIVAGLRHRGIGVLISDRSVRLKAGAGAPTGRPRGACLVGCEAADVGKALLPPNLVSTASIRRSSLPCCRNRLSNSQTQAARRPIMMAARLKPMA